MKLSVLQNKKTTALHKRGVCGGGWGGVHRAKACVCDGCCHTEADRLARCEGGDLPGLSGHV